MAKKKCNCPESKLKIDSINSLPKTNLNTKSISLPQSEVSADILRRRRNKCRYCEFSTKDKKTASASSNGLTSKSICTKNNENIAEFTAKEKSECPLKYWD